MNRALDFREARNGVLDVAGDSACWTLAISFYSSFRGEVAAGLSLLEPNVGRIGRRRTVISGAPRVAIDAVLVSLVQLGQGC